MRTLLVILCSLVLAHTGSSARPAGWTAVREADATHGVHVVIAVAHVVPQETLQTACQAVSDPDSDTYGQHLTAEQVAALVAGNGTHVEQIVSWLESLGAEGISVVLTRDWVSATLPAAVVSRTLGTTMMVWQHHLSGTQIIRAAAGSFTKDALPASVVNAVEVVLGVWEFPPQRPRLVPLPGHKRAPSAGVAPYQPDVNICVLNATSGTLGFSQQCYNSTFTGVAPPCVNDTDPIVSYQLKLQIDGHPATIVHVPLTDVACVYVYGLVQCTATPPIDVPTYSFVNMSIAAVSRSGLVSSFGSLPWTNVSFADQRMEASPFVTPHLLWKFYGLADPRDAKPVPSVTQAVVEFFGDYYAPTDLAAFASTFSLGQLPPVTVVGPNNASQPGDEASLDIQWIAALAPKVPITFWSIDPFTADGYFLTWAYQMSNATHPPLVSSISYGQSEQSYVAQYGPLYIQRTDTELLKLCTRGLSVLFASGDSGSSGNGDCNMEPVFPASSPWVTSVSASFITNRTVARPAETLGEIAVSIPNGMLWTTGGGFSNVHPAPWYQKQAIQEYLSVAGSLLPPASLFNKSGRAYPDVSALGHNLLVFQDGTAGPVDGTSAASPIFAGIVSRLNMARAAAGKSAVGFLNPVLYKLYSLHPAAFYDLTQGDNSCGFLQCCAPGYPITKGFDAVTGVGSLGTYSVLESYVLSLP